MSTSARSGRDDGRATERERGSVPPPTPRAPVNILLVDDRPENLVALKSILASADHRLVTATSGADALRALLNDEFALILLDVVMPDMDGFEVARLIKARERTAHIPIIFLTAADSDVKFIYRGYSLGAVDYLVKPVDADVVRAKASVFVELFRKGVQIREQAELLRQAEARERAHQLREFAKASETRYRNLAEAIPHIVWTARPDGAVEYYNERWFQFTGLTPDESASWGWVLAVHPDDKASCLEKWREALRTGESCQHECRLRRAGDGVYRWQLCRALPERDANGRIVAWLGTYTDVDDQKQMYVALDQFKQSLDAAVDAVWMFDPDTLRFHYTNEGASAQLRYAPEQLAAIRACDVLPAFDERALRSLVAPLLDGSRAAITVETFARGADGKELPVELSIQYITPRGVHGRLVAIVRDITERRRAEEELARLYGEARAAVRARDEFLSIASHELKTPVTALQLHLRNLSRGILRDAPSLADRVAPRIQSLERSATRLTRLIDTLLDISRITVGRIELTIDQVDLAALVRDSVDRAREEARRAECELVVRADAPVLGRWDSMRLDQVVTNLISNAVKYGAGKPIDITVESNATSAVLSVRDRGIGIAPEDQARIFERFERAVSERQYGGLGLGLWIVRQIVLAIGGEIRVESAPGAGSTFTIELPLDVAPIARASGVPPPNRTGTPLEETAVAQNGE